MGFLKYHFKPVVTKTQKETMFYTKMSYLFSLFYYKRFSCYLKTNSNARFQEKNLEILMLKTQQEFRTKTGFQIGLDTI